MNWRDLMTAPAESCPHNPHNPRNPGGGDPDRTRQHLPPQSPQSPKMPSGGSSADIGDSGERGSPPEPDTAPEASLEPVAGPGFLWAITPPDGAAFLLSATPSMSRGEVEARHPGALIELEVDPWFPPGAHLEGPQ